MSDLRSLIEAAKTDAPTAAARTKVWAGVSSVIGGATGAAALAGSASAAKMLVLGTLLGGALTVGVGAALLFVGAPPPLDGTSVEVAGRAAAAPATRVADPARVVARAPVTHVAESTAVLESTEAPRSTLLGNPAALSIAAPSSSATRASAALSVRPHPAHAVSVAAPASLEDGALAREASLLAGARSAIGRGDAASALQMVRGLRAEPARQLIPEELAVEAQALRALGQNDDANQLDTALRTRFPDSALGR